MGIPPPPFGAPPPPFGAPPPPFGAPPPPPGIPPPPGGIPPPPGGVPPPPGGLPTGPPGAFRPPPQQVAAPANEAKIDPPPKGLIPKRLHWKTLPKFKLKNTFFGKEFNPNDFQAQIDYDLLHETFCKREEELKQEEAEKKKMQVKTSKVVFVLEQKKISDVGIQLSGYNISGEDTVGALMSLDDAILDIEKIQKLQRICPSAEET